MFSKIATLLLFVIVTATNANKTKADFIQAMYLESSNGDPIELLVSTNKAGKISEIEITVFNNTVTIKKKELGKFYQYPFNGVNVSVDKNGIELAFTRGGPSRIWSGFSVSIAEDMSYTIEELRDLCTTE